MLIAAVHQRSLHDQAMSIGDEGPNRRLSPEPHQPETSAEAESARPLKSASVSESPFSGFTLSLPEAFEHGVDQYDEVLVDRISPSLPPPLHPSLTLLLCCRFEAHYRINGACCSGSFLHHLGHQTHS